MRRLEVERIDGVPAAGPLGPRPVGLGPEMRPWGRDHARQPPSMAKGASPRSGCGARGSCLARTAPVRLRVTVRPYYEGLPSVAGRGRASGEKSLR
jgi:hypothetical protein